MSKERAQRRAEREREAAVRAEAQEAARAVEARRRARRAARKKAIESFLPRFGVGSHQGVLARKRRIQTIVLIDLLVVLNLVLWFATGDWAIRVLVLIASVLCFPVLKTLLFPR